MISLERGSTTNPAVTVEDLEKRFGAFTAVDHISLSVNAGTIFGFLGPNGAGKSTTIRMLCGLLAPTSGRGAVGGHDITTESERIKESIGYMSQKFSLYEDLTVEQNLDFFGGIYRLDRGRLEARKEWVVEMAGLKDHRNAKTGILSGGWKQRLSLGCAILHEPPIIFLDEPTSGVDPLSRRAFWDLIHGMAERGTTVFVTTHYMEEAEYCDQLALIYRGRLIASGTPAELKHERMSEDVLEITCDKSQDVISEIEQVTGVREAALFGRGIHAVVSNAEIVMARIGEFMADRGLQPVRIEQITPTLEDVFVSLIEDFDRRNPEPMQ